MLTYAPPGRLARRSLRTHDPMPSRDARGRPVTSACLHPAVRNPRTCQLPTAWCRLLANSRFVASGRDEIRIHARTGIGGDAPRDCLCPEGAAWRGRVRWLLCHGWGSPSTSATDCRRSSRPAVSTAPAAILGPQRCRRAGSSRASVSVGGVKKPVGPGECESAGDRRDPDRARMPGAGVSARSHQSSVDQVACEPAARDGRSQAAALAGGRGVRSKPQKDSIELDNARDPGLGSDTIARLGCGGGPL